MPKHKKENIISLEEFLEEVTYNPVTGRFTYNFYNRGRPAGSFVESQQNNYFMINFKGKRNYAHQLAYRIMCNDLSLEGVVIDHINSNTLDNRFCNLQAVTYSQNSLNRRLASNSTVGVKGIYLCKKTNKYKAHIMLESKRYHLGYFNTLEEAQITITNARNYFHKEYGNHG